MQIIDRLFVFFREKNLSNYKVEQSCGLSNGYLRNLRKAPSAEIIERILSVYPELNREWVMTGQGEMIRSSESGNVSHKPKKESVPSQPKQKDVPVAQHVTDGGIPLIPVDAMAGFANGDDRAVLEYECEHYVVPMFREADFLIPVKGSSMMPKYNSGDLVACKHLPLNDLFFQWNHVYVLSTDQGALIKRVQKADDNNHILCVSDNEKYPPFTLHRNQIHAIALVIGVIRLE
ncbi:MAG: helix-turn-helix transcriptional regulator [Paludibacteraceae bacterium]|nr:helix-turn-helix transcriptional regulator [Paludibacteraceae bacterium]